MRQWEGVCPADTYSNGGGSPQAETVEEGSVVIAECWTVILVLLLVVGVYLHRGKNRLAMAVLPLVLVPLAHVIGAPVSVWVEDVFPGDSAFLQIAIDVAALVVANMIFGAFSRGYQGKGSRRAYMVLCAGFTVLFSWVLIFNTWPR